MRFKRIKKIGNVILYYLFKTLRKRIILVFLIKNINLLVFC